MEGTTTAESVLSLELVVAQSAIAIQQAKADLTKLQRRLLFLNGSLLFLKLSKSVRQFVDDTIVWRPGAVLIGGTAMAGVGLAGLSSPVMGGVGGILGWVAMVFIVLYPSDVKGAENAARLNNELAELELKVPEIVARQQDMKWMWQSDSARLRNLRRALECEQASRIRYRTFLFDERWKEMRGVEFETFLESVFTALGYTVETTKVTGDQGLDLIVSYRHKRIGIQVKGWADPVGNGAVQEAHTGMTHYKCDAAAVITNSRFTRGAVDLANGTGCILIDEYSLPNLILGKIDLWSMCFGEDN